MSSKILAVHLSSSRLCTAVAEATIGTFKLSALSDGPAPADGAQAGLDGQWDRVLATLPADLAVYRMLDLPFRDRRRLDQAVGPALEEHVPLSLDEATAVYDFTSPERSGPILAAMAATAALERLYAQLGALGAAPHKIIWAPCATLEVYRQAIDTGGGATVIDASDDGAVIAVLDGPRLLELRVLSPSSDELLLRNVAYSLRTMHLPSKRVVIGGPRAAVVAEAVGKAPEGFAIEGLPQRCPLEGVEGSEWRDAAPAIGLLYAASGGLLAPALDFSVHGGGLLGRLPELAGELRPLLPWAAAALGLALLAAGIDYARLASQRASLRSQASAIFASAMPGASSDKGAKLKLEMRLSELTGGADKGAGGAVSPLRVLALMSQAVPKNVNVEFDGFYQSPPTVRVTGKGDSFESVTRLQQSLVDSGHFGKVEVKDVRSAVGGDGVDFQLLLRLDGTEASS